MCNLCGGGGIIQPITGRKLRLAFTMKCKRRTIFTYVHISTRTLKNFLRLLRKTLGVNYVTGTRTEVISKIKNDLD